MTVTDNILDYDKILLFGDSLMEFCFRQLPISHEYAILDNENDVTKKNNQFTLGSGLVDVYSRKLDIIHRAFAGYNSLHLKIILKKLFEKNNLTENLKLMILTVGTNDSSTCKNVQCALPDYIKNIKEIIRMVKARGIKLVVFGLPKYYPEIFKKYCLADVENGYFLDNSIIESYNSNLGRICKIHGIPFLDLNALMSSYDENLTSDGIHLSGYCQYLVFKELLSIIKNELPDLHPENFAKKLPESYFVTIDELEDI
ncbi:SGNH hydrolase [Ascoidea rubescens DSM 1968]|uniref:SGNH hydrolase n=1 Tax=Ascoidea rubescens DSM 1968 TaxID=1344418 RepID=A0A1D2VEG7_9ASCO|nr:SGNH hydrolase [Ascoidea rubescens DSM 1968]ODV60026.1 SGNH hydrolase [Ascoidea rubescens DSM 1968]